MVVRNFDFGSNYVRVGCRESKMEDLRQAYTSLLFRLDWSALDRQKIFVNYIRRMMDKELTYSIESKNEEKA